MKPFTNLLTSAIVLIALMSCSSLTGGETDKQYIPPVPDYTNDKMWVKFPNDATGLGADVFYIPSTWEFDWTTQDGKISHYADITSQKHLDNMAIEMTGVAEYMAEDNNFYSPYYRHITLDSWATLNEGTIARRYHAVSFVDVQNAFRQFLSERDENRGFILAGFSQGAKSVVELLKTLPEHLRDKMIAAYVLGYKVTPEDIAAAPWIKPAQYADDTGVVVCYNSVSDVRYVKSIVSAPNVMCINPVNWRTDATPAKLNDTITVALNPEYNVLVLEGFDGSYLPNILGILNTGDYHGIEPWVYSECLRRNFRQRINTFYNNR